MQESQVLFRKYSAFQGFSVFTGGSWLSHFPLDDKKVLHTSSSATKIGIWYLNHSTILNATKRDKWLAWARARQISQVYIAPHAGKDALISIPGVEGSPYNDHMFCNFIHLSGLQNMDVQLLSDPKLDMPFIRNCTKKRKANAHPSIFYSEKGNGWTECQGRAFAGVCRDISNFANLTASECQAKCVSISSGCTAVNSCNAGAGPCALRKCPIGEPPTWILPGTTGFAHYHLTRCDSPSPAPPANASNISYSQVHMSLGSTPNTYVVTWSTNLSLVNVGRSKIKLTSQPQNIHVIVIGSEEKFIDNGTLRHTQYIHRANLSALVHGARYRYRVTCDGGIFCNSSFDFVAQFPGVKEAASFTLFGDMGWWNDKIFPQLKQDALQRDTDLIIHIGDIAYDLHDDNATVGDHWLNNMQPVAALQPYMVAQGNHEAIYDGLNYRKRFTMPNYDVSHNLWYSFDFGDSHWIGFTSEAYFTMKDHRYPEIGRDSWGPYPQWIKDQRAFIERDLAAAAARRDSKKGPRWLFAFGHRAMYCSDRGCENEMASPQHLKFQHDLESLFYSHGVDIIFAAHWHTYERTWPVFNGTVLNGTDDPLNPYKNPKGPIHIIAGAAGCQEHADDFNGSTTNPWSAVRIGRSEYGYGKLRVWNSTHVSWEQLRAPDGVTRDQIMISKTKLSYNE